jgi:hypothetical protein
MPVCASPVDQIVRFATNGGGQRNPDQEAAASRQFIAGRRSGSAHGQDAPACHGRDSSRWTAGWEALAQPDAVPWNRSCGLLFGAKARYPSSARRNVSTCAQERAGFVSTPRGGFAPADGEATVTP